MGMVSKYNETTDVYEYYGNELDHHAVNQYYCSVKSILQQQMIEGGKCLHHADLKYDHIKNLLKMVVERKDLERKVLYREQLDFEFLPYRMVSNIERLDFFVVLQ